MAGLRIGIVYETPSTYLRRPGDPADFAAEYEPDQTIVLIEESLRHLGHHPIRIGAPAALLKAEGQARARDLDAALNIAEGFGSRNRESWAPALLEMLGVPTLGSDGLSLSASLDKAWALRIVAGAGVPVPRQCSVASVSDLDSIELPGDYPFFVKPRWEGTAKGIRASSRVETASALEAEVARIVEDYRQPALVEEFVSGAEYTVTVVGHGPPRALPVVQRALEAESRIGYHAVDRAADSSHEVTETDLEPCTPGELSPELEAQLQRYAVVAFEALECLDFARADFRLDDRGTARFLEINPLPTFAPDGTFGILSELEGRPAQQLLAEVFAEGLARLGLGPGPGPAPEPASGLKRRVEGK